MLFHLLTTPPEFWIPGKSIWTIGPFVILGNLGAPNGRVQILSMFHSLASGPIFGAFTVPVSIDLLIALSISSLILWDKDLTCFLPRPLTAIGGMNCDLLGARAACWAAYLLTLPVSAPSDFWRAAIEAFSFPRVEAKLLSCWFATAPTFPAPFDPGAFVACCLSF